MIPNELFDLTGKVAIVVGASRGMGAEIAKAYSDAGAQVVISSRKSDSLQKIAREIETGGGEVVAVSAHTGDTDSIQNLVDRTIEAFHGIDILVNNAGTNPHFGPILEVEDAAWDKTFDVNLRGHLRTARACIESMRQRGGGKIINMASVAGRRPEPGMGVYSVTKAALIMLTEVLSVELAGDNIQVNAIAPGFIKTRFSRAIWQNRDLFDKIVRGIPQKRFAEAHEVVGIALYLASNASSFTTGATFVIDGGQLLQ